MSRGRKRKKSWRHKLGINQSNIKVEPKYGDNEFIFCNYRPCEAKKRETKLNEFICIECNNLNLVDELSYKETEIFTTKDLPCKCCGKVTTQICIKDKLVTKLHLEMATEKTENEKIAQQAIFKQTREISKQKTKGSRKNRTAKSKQ